MKLQHLAIGARFEYEGQIFVKTGPLTASSDQGGQRIIPRYAVLQPLDTPAGYNKVIRGKLTETAVRAAFDTFYRQCQRLVDEKGQAELDAARKRFLATFD